MRKSIAIVAAVAVVVLVAALIVHQRAGRRSDGSGADLAPRGQRAPGLVLRIHYHLAYQQAITMTGRAPTEIDVDGEWITTPRRDGRIEVRFAPARLEGPKGALPAATALAAPVQLVAVNDVLAAMGFPAAMPEPARALMTALATTFQHTDRAGSSWTAAEDDVMGRYDAAYQRSGDVLARSRGAYRAMRGAGGLSPHGAHDVTPSEQSRFTLDGDGLVGADVALDLRIKVGEGAPSVDVRLRASLERTAIEWVQPPIGPAFPAEPISDHADRVAAARSADESLIAGASLAQLLDEITRKGTGKEHARALSRLAAYLRLNPAAAAEVADALRAHAADRDLTQLLAGALASARVPEGTDALAGLALAQLPASAQTDVVNALTLSEPVTAASLDALDQSLDGADARQAALALGSHVRRADADLSSRSHDAVQQLLARYAAASSDAERTILAQALGNSGSPDALPLLRGLIHGGNPQLAGAAVFSLRFLSGDQEVDAMLASALGDADLAFSAVRAIGFREPTAWRDRLIDAQDQYAKRNDILAAIQAILRRWG